MIPSICLSLREADGITSPTDVLKVKLNNTANEVGLYSVGHRRVQCR
jgi:hypothetical protein